jgi:hypothetical protein
MDLSTGSGACPGSASVLRYNPVDILRDGCICDGSVHRRVGVVQRRAPQRHVRTMKPITRCPVCDRSSDV